MKKYPKALADLDALRDTIQYLYMQAERAEDEGNRYAELALEEDDAWTRSQIVECHAKAEAYTRLAEKLSK